MQNYITINKSSDCIHARVDLYTRFSLMSCTKAWSAPGRPPLPPPAPQTPTPQTFPAPDPADTPCLLPYPLLRHASPPNLPPSGLLWANTSGCHSHLCGFPVPRLGSRFIDLKRRHARLPSTGSFIKIIGVTWTSCRSSPAPPGGLDPLRVAALAVSTRAPGDDTLL